MQKFFPVKFQFFKNGLYICEEVFWMKKKLMLFRLYKTVDQDLNNDSDGIGRR